MASDGEGWGGTEHGGLNRTLIWSNGGGLLPCCVEIMLTVRFILNTGSGFYGQCC